MSTMPSRLDVRPGVCPLLGCVPLATTEDLPGENLATAGAALQQRPVVGWFGTTFLR